MASLLYIESWYAAESQSIKPKKTTMGELCSQVSGVTCGRYIETMEREKGECQHDAN